MSGLPKPVYVMSEPHLSGYRVIIGYETLSEAQDAQAALCQPPAREDAQPVAWRLRPNDGLTYDWAIVQSDPNKTAKVRADLYDVQPLYTHPAPDALRAAVAKLEKAKITDDPAEVFMLAMEALAALQAEQKGGAA